MSHYPDVEPNPHFPELEKDILAYWQRGGIFEKSVAQRSATLPHSASGPLLNPHPACGGGKGGDVASSPDSSPPHTNNEFIFYDGPPFANGLPHYGHLLTGYVKDVFARYQTMRGRRVERRFGWDCHGLPAEMGSEKELGISGRAAITEFGIGKFNEHCRSSVMKYTNEWEDYVNRQARWVDFDNDYKTMDTNFMESVLWAFKQLYDKGLVYEAYRVMPYSWAAETPLSNFETKLDNSYREREDKAIYVAFELNKKPKGVGIPVGKHIAKYCVIAWTTTPWTLPANLALAASNQVQYTYHIDGDTVYIATTGALNKLFGTKYVIGAEIGTDEVSADQIFSKDLIGLTYKPLFPYFENADNAFQILDGSEFVTDTDGTGIVHMAPAFGEDDFKLCQKHSIGKYKLPLTGLLWHNATDEEKDAFDSRVFVCPVDGQGKYTDAIFDLESRPPLEGGSLSLRGLNVIADTRKDEAEPYTEAQLKKFGLANLRIINYLKQTGQLIKQEDFKHNYPHCWRTDQPLIYRAMPSWYVEVTKFRDRAVEINKQINWIPEHIRDGQMAHMLATAPDWSISRNRFWGTPIPVWRREGSGAGVQATEMKVFGSIAELEDFFDLDACGIKPEAQSPKPCITDLHRPFIDQLTIAKDGSKWRRVEDVFDCWFESGSMPFAQVHYPFENKEWFETHFPADFITEYVGQTRGWFNTLIMLSTALFDKAPFKNCICHGVVLDSETGLKYSKRLKNYKDPMEVMDKFGADSLRWLMISSPVMRGHDLAVDPEGKFIRDVVRLAIKPIWNAYNFFCLYANADGVVAKNDANSGHFMDMYILAKCKESVSKIEASLDAYDTPSACDAVMQFFEVLNNWYIRRSKERFWAEAKSESKQAAYDTLYTVLVTMCKAAAPLLPLTLDAVYKGLTNDESVHLADFSDTSNFLPRTNEQGIKAIILVMDNTRDTCNAGLSIRNAKNLRVRLPLTNLTLITKNKEIMTELFDVTSIIKDELNIKTITFEDDLTKYATLKLSINSQILGKRLPAMMKQILPASKKGEWKQVEGGIEICGERLLPEEYTLQLEPKPEYAGRAQALSTNDALVILDTEITEELKREGLARDLVRAIQQARKDAGLHVSDRIDLGVVGDVATIISDTELSDYIKQQTLASSLNPATLDSHSFTTEAQLDEMTVTITLKKAA